MNKNEVKAYINGGLGGVLLGAGIAAICRGVQYLTTAEYQDGVPQENGKIAKLVEADPNFAEKLKNEGSVKIQYQK